MSKSQILSNEDELKRTQEKSMKQIQTNINEFVSNEGRAEELAAFFKSATYSEILGSTDGTQFSGPTKGGIFRWLKRV